MNPPHYLIPFLSICLPLCGITGLRSSGVHSNGYSLVRKCVEKSGSSSCSASHVVYVLLRSCFVFYFLHLIPYISFSTWASKATESPRLPFSLRTSPSLFPSAHTTTYPHPSASTPRTIMGGPRPLSTGRHTRKRFALPDKDIRG